jgi:two-component system chemotaxis response regulator CheB
VPKIRVLVVDDSAVFRRLLTEALAGDPALDVVGTAANGRMALARLPQVAPDIVILDVEMPEMDGLAMLAELRKTYPRLPVIMFSALTERGAQATLEALSLGATDYFTKPQCGGMEASLDVIRHQLIPEIKTLCAPKPRQVADPRGGSGSCRAVLSPRAASGPIQVLALATSTGGPNALADVFGKLPADFAVPIVLVQHMPPMFTRLLAERLTAHSAIRVQEGSSGTLLESGQAWIAPGDHHMVLVRDGGKVRLLLNQDPPENSCRPAADVLFRSVASVFGVSALAVVLTGMGQDGLRGCEAIRAAGGQVVVQDEASSVVWGMPGHVVRAGLADRVMPLCAIGDEIVQRVWASRAPAGRGDRGRG